MAIIFYCPGCYEKIAFRKNSNVIGKRCQCQECKRVFRLSEKYQQPPEGMSDETVHLIREASKGPEKSAFDTAMLLAESPPEGEDPSEETSLLEIPSVPEEPSPDETTAIKPPSDPSDETSIIEASPSSSSERAYETDVLSPEDMKQYEESQSQARGTNRGPSIANAPAEKELRKKLKGNRRALLIVSVLVILGSLRGIASSLQTLNASQRELALLPSELASLIKMFAPVDLFLSIAFLVSAIGVILWKEWARLTMAGLFCISILSGSLFSLLFYNRLPQKSFAMYFFIVLFAKIVIQLCFLYYLLNDRAQALMENGGHVEKALSASS